ncbi:Pyrroline-5-carboxylate reductase 3 [Holothuria leucospilota]|uniref:Pyrroline-5-carboxylate reductase 3 n=1 Tax=Holothuria leucospilota TaxID=206669 RepID=A0A9Q1CS77_HOLLE|nr:Pyrroline-5-carboxylate reductase 3 [Holothuria leucospilota]
MVSTLVIFSPSRTLQPSQIKTSAPSDRNFGILKEHSVGTTHDNREVTKFADIIFLACKPYQIQDVAKEISADLSTERHLVVSCAAGLPMINLESVSILNLIRLAHTYS